MLFVGWQGVCAFLAVSIIVCLMIVFFAKKIRQSALHNKRKFAAQHD